MAPPAAWSLGPIVFVLCEFQILDRETEARTSSVTRATTATRIAKTGSERRLKIGVRALKEGRTAKSRSTDHADSTEARRDPERPATIDSDAPAAVHPRPKHDEPRCPIYDASADRAVRPPSPPRHRGPKKRG